MSLVDSGANAMIEYHFHRYKIAPQRWINSSEIPDSDSVKLAIPAHTKWYAGPQMSGRQEVSGFKLR